jgi:hypothetical protein
MSKLGLIALMALACMACKDRAKTAENTAPVVEPVAHVTIVGCVQPSGAQPSGQTADTNYMLTNSRPGNTPTKDAIGTSGASSQTYRLDATDATVSPEVGHEVEIIAASPQPDPSGRPKLKVETIKMVAMKCD